MFQVFERPPCITSKNILFEGKKLFTDFVAGFLEKPDVKENDVLVDVMLEQMITKRTLTILLKI